MTPKEIKQQVNDTVVKGIMDEKTPRYKTRSTIQMGSNAPYSGINQLLLQLKKNREGFAGNRRLTFKNISDQGYRVLKGEKATPVIFYKTLISETLNDEGNVDEKKIPLMKTYAVFNRDQTSMPQEEEKHIVEAERIINNHDYNREQGSHPSYNSLFDRINIPHINNFTSPDDYYTALFHELSHRTGHKDRLNREGINQYVKRGGKEYAKEELIAELSACFLSAFSNIDHSKSARSYLKGRLKPLDNDPNYLISATSQGWKATEYIMRKGKEDLFKNFSS